MKKQIANTTKNCSESFINLLLSEQSSPEINKVDIYDQLMGCWKVEVLDYADDGTMQKSTGDWVFSYVLAGRAIQDLFVTSGLANKRSNRFGTTIRMIDPVTQQWKIFWFNPLSGARNELTAHADGENIVHQGFSNLGNLIRWTFTDIKENSFHWSGEESIDQGKSWKLSSEFFAKRE
jgi:hypothetical protein